MRSRLPSSTSNIAFVSRIYKSYSCLFCKRYNSNESAELLKRLSLVDTAALCDAHKSIYQAKHNNHFHVLPNSLIPLRNVSTTLGAPAHPSTMVGLVYTVQCDSRNDILPVLEGLLKCPPHHVLVVHTKQSDCAVAGELFATEAKRRNISGIVILDGSMRDTGNINKASQIGKVSPIYSYSVTPYSGTASAIGTLNTPLEFAIPRSDQIISISPGDIIVGDCDGIIISSQVTMETLIDLAESIGSLEHKLLQKMRNGSCLIDMTNLCDHLERLEHGETSTLEFKI